MVLEKDSSVLGYPGEIAKALEANHNEICKYEDPLDPNYIIVRNVLKSLVSKIITADGSKTSKPDLSSRRASLDLKSLLAISEPTATDYIFFRDQWTEGTNHWILGNQDFQAWRDSPEPKHQVLWLSGRAATGKSIMASFLVDGLVSQGAWCQHFFIRFGDQKKRTLSLLLRSLSYQLAQTVPGFLQQVAGLADEAIDFETVDPKIIWDRIFKSVLFRTHEAKTIYWVIDGLDEALEPAAAIKLFSDISSSPIPIRLLFTSRETSEISTGFKRLASHVQASTISIEGHVEDLRCHIREQLSVSGGEGFRDEVEQRIIQSSQNNFLVSPAQQA